MRTPLALSALVVATVAFSTAPLSSSQSLTADTATLIKLLEVEAGDVVAEIGAGSGDLTLAMAKQVGDGGRVYTSELGTERLARLRQAVERVGNVTVVTGEAAHANLPEACCDAIFMRNVYHHFADPATMNASLARALKPGGRLAIIDFPPRGSAATAPPGQRSERAHGVHQETVADELKAAGLQIRSSDTRTDRWFVVVAQK